ncbi:aminoglycoside phosphotransferase family protein [Actinokineospora inagensis]|uniref:aminoglycoside phosphotransferase family protein n=1 Tax=Actinokineospora inagensis TaxID=103730 RepID=UPI0003FE2638|nr:aminoglycoside phosphotransferase family protein [Actinokineospora inagensis]
MPITVPPRLRAYYAKHSPEHLPWLTDLPTLATTALDRWNLHPDGPPRHGMVAIVIPVHRPDGTPAALKLQPRDHENDGEAPALRHWHGDGTVHLLDHDEPTGTLLLERLNPDRPLSTLPTDQALPVIAQLLERLHRTTAPPGIRPLTTITTAMLTERPLLHRLTHAHDRALALTCADATADIATEPPGDRLLHWDLHYGNALAADREPWLAIDPKPLTGHPGFDLMPALANQWTDNTPHRFDQLTEHLDRAAATAWTLARVLQNTLWDLHDGATTLDPVQAAIATALLTRLP